MQNMLTWTMNDVYIYLYSADALGNYNPNAPLLEYCFCDNIKVDGSCSAVMRERSGKPTRELIQPGAWDHYTANLASLYVGHEQELNQSEVFNRSKWLVMEILFSSGLRESETRKLLQAKATSLSLVGQDNQGIIINATFDASQFI